MNCIRAGGLITSILILCASSLPAQGGGAMRGNTGRAVGTERSSTPLPEPTTIALLALGAGGVGLAMRGRRRAKQQQNDGQAK